MSDRLGEGELCEPCLQATIQRGLGVFAITQETSLSHAEANLLAPPYREILCARCADIALQKKPGAGDDSKEESGGPGRSSRGQAS